MTTKPATDEPCRFRWNGDDHSECPRCAGTDIDPRPINKPASVAPSWADRYRAAAHRCLALQDAETDDLVRSALGDYAARYTLAMLDHERIADDNARRAAGLDPLP